uniref:Ig-like domain-containing protein n=1 Tax=Laticauda laticaudata TaxID=8630 RepID=A0A8C5RT94_LATLA
MREDSLGQRSPTFVAWLGGRKNWAKRWVSTHMQLNSCKRWAGAQMHARHVSEFLNYNRNRILWQIKDRFSCFVAGYFPNENMEKYQCEEFKQRTLLNEPKQGSASLQLSNIRIADEFIYQCIIQKDINGQFKLIHNESISLKVQIYSKPVITGPVQLGEEMMFMCNSSHGYPEQRLYWRNEINNKLDGTFSVFSVTIEHKQLHQNITTTSNCAGITIPFFALSPCSHCHQWMQRGCKTLKNVGKNAMHPLCTHWHTCFIRSIRRASVH